MELVAAELLRIDRFKASLPICRHLDAVGRRRFKLLATVKCQIEFDPQSGALALKFALDLGGLEGLNGDISSRPGHDGELRTPSDSAIDSEIAFEA